LSCGKSPDAVLREYFRTIRCHVEVVSDIDPAILAAVRQGIRDPDDAPFLALHIERRSAGIITYDDDLRSHPDAKCYELADVAKIHVTYHRQFIVVGVGSLGACLGIGVMKMLVEGLQALFAMLQLAARHFKFVAVGAGVVMLVGYLFRQQIASFLSDSLGLTGDRWRRFKVLLREFWGDMKPIALALLDESTKRIAAAQARTQELQLGLHGPDGKNEAKRGQGAVGRVTYGLRFRCIMLAKRRPMLPDELLAAVEGLGYGTDSLGDVDSVQAILRESRVFAEHADGRFTLLRDDGHQDPSLRSEALTSVAAEGSKELSRAFAAVRSAFFPLWDRRREWTVVPSGAAGSRCHRETRTIRVEDAAGEDMEAILIHEICHAVTTTAHGTIWRRRMEKAAGRADRAGRPGLARRIREDFAAYRSERPVRAEDVYNQVRDALIGPDPPSFDSVLSWLSTHHGLLREELLGRYRCLRRVYDEARSRNERYGMYR